MSETSDEQTLIGRHQEISLRPLAILYSCLMVTEVAIAFITASNVFWTEASHLLFDTIGAWALAWAGDRADSMPLVVSLIMSSMTVMFMLINMGHVITFSEHIDHREEKRYSVLMLTVALVSCLSLCVTWWVMRRTCRLGCCTGIAARTMRVHVTADVFGNVSMIALGLMHLLNVNHQDIVDSILSFTQSTLLTVLSLMVIHECFDWLTGCPGKVQKVTTELTALKGVKRVELVVCRYMHSQAVFDVALDVTSIDFEMNDVKDTILEHGQVGIVQTTGLIPFFQMHRCNKC